jgi:hypothetical protein
MKCQIIPCTPAVEERIEMDYSKDMVKAKQSGRRASNTKVNGKKICKTVKA